MRIDNAGYVVQTTRNLLCERVSLVALRPRNPDVNRRRLAEIQDLINNIRRLEEELQFPKALWQFAT